jgi:hypothetical protein
MGPAMTIYIFLDTSILVRIVSQGKPGCEIAQFTALKTLVEGGAVRLLVPEVVLLELEKSRRTFATDLDLHYEALKASIRKPSVWSEMQDIQNSLLEHLDERRRLKLDTAAHNFRPPDTAPISPCFFEISRPQFDENRERVF